jgi:hypothetical protein
MVTVQERNFGARARRGVASSGLAVALLTTSTVFAGGAPKHATTKAAGAPKAAPSAPAADAATASPATTVAPKPSGAAEHAAPAATGDTSNVVSTQAGKEGVNTYKFGAVEVEGRLRSPQLIYFLRRVRAEFGAGDLGHRSFLRELSETARQPAFR